MVRATAWTSLPRWNFHIGLVGGDIHQRLVSIDEDELLLSGLIDEEYTRHPFYGDRRMVIFLCEAGRCVNRKRCNG